MAAIEYTLKNVVGVYPFPQDVEAMAKNNGRIRVPCVGFTNKSIASKYKGHYVKVIAERYTASNGGMQSDWKYLSVDEAVLGWRTNEGDQAKGNWMVYLLVDNNGVPVIVPRSSKRPQELRAG